MRVIDVGYATTSKETGIAEATLRQWAKRGNWWQSKTHSQAVTTVTTSPADAQVAELQENERETRLGLSRNHRRHATGDLSPKEALQVAQGAQITHGWRNSEKDQAQVAVNIAILSA